MTGARRVFRRVLVVGSVLSVVAAVYVTALWPVYVRPRADHPAAADAVVVLGGAHPRDREQLGFELVRDGYAPQLILSNSHYGDDLPDHDQTLNRICASTYSFKVHCLAPVPDTTRGEAREIVRLAREERWQRVIVVTFIPHLSRARYIIGKCFAGEVLMVPARSRLSVREWAYNYVHQSFGYGRAYFENC